MMAAVYGNTIAAAGHQAINGVSSPYPEAQLERNQFVNGLNEASLDPRDAAGRRGRGRRTATTVLYH